MSKSHHTGAKHRAPRHLHQRAAHPRTAQSPSTPSRVPSPKAVTNAIVRAVVDRVAALFTRSAWTG